MVWLSFDILTSPLTIAAVWPPVANISSVITMFVTSLCNRGTELSALSTLMRRAKSC